MPIYEYECLNCGKRTEALQRMGEGPIAACPACGGEVKKLISSPAFQFKGTGWYVTDYAGKKGGGTDRPPGETKSEGKSEVDSSAGKAESKSSEGRSSAGKSEAKSEGKAEKAEKTEKVAASESKGSGGAE